MFNVFDYATGDVLTFKTQQSLIDWWKKTEGKKNFDELNITGNDLHPSEPIVYWDQDLCDYKEVRNKQPGYIKRYTVTDNTGRSVDIRDWPDELWEHKKEPIDWAARFPRMYNGHKRRCRRTKGMSFNHHDLQNYASIDEDDLPDNVSLQAIKKRKPPTGWASWDCVDKRMKNKGTKPKSWKNQTKSTKQYNKHKKHTDYDPDSFEEEPELDLDPDFYDDDDIIAA